MDLEALPVEPESFQYVLHGKRGQWDVWEPWDGIDLGDFIGSGGHTDEPLIAPESLTPSARVDGKHILALETEPHAPILGIGEIPHGNGEVGESSGDVEVGSEPTLKVAAILTTWEARSVGRGLRPRTMDEYRNYFVRFAKHIGLESRDKKWLASKGHDAAIAWVMSLREKSRAPAFAALHSVWTYGIPEVAFPIDRKRDFGLRVLPKAGQRECPSDAEVEPLFRKAENEDDLYLKSFVLVALSTGLRPGNQLAQLQWADIREWHGGLAIGAESKPGRKFKTDAPIYARLPPMASDALKAWREQTPYKAPSDYLWPRRQYGEITNQKGDDQMTEREYFRFLNRHHLETWVRPCHLRHWIEYRGQKDGIPSVHLAYIRGHSVQAATEGALGYSGNRKWEGILEDQEERWPLGPCGVFIAGQVSVRTLDPFVALAEQLDLTLDDIKDRIESIRLARLRQAQTPQP